MKKLFTLRNVLLYSALIFGVVAADFGFRKAQELLEELRSDTKTIASLNKEVSELKALSAQIVHAMPMKTAVAPTYPEPLPLPSAIPNAPIKSDEHKVKLPATKDADTDNGKITLIGDDVKVPSSANTFKLLGDK